MYLIPLNDAWISISWKNLQLIFSGLTDGSSRSIQYFIKTQDFNPLNLFFSFTQKIDILTLGQNNVLSTRLALQNYAAAPSQTEKVIGEAKFENPTTSLVQLT